MQTLRRLQIDGANKDLLSSVEGMGGPEHGTGTQRPETGQGSPSLYRLSNNRGHSADCGRV